MTFGIPRATSSASSSERRAPTRFPARSAPSACISITSIACCSSDRRFERSLTSAHASSLPPVLELSMMRVAPRQPAEQPRLHDVRDPPRDLERFFERAPGPDEVPRAQRAERLHLDHLDRLLLLGQALRALPHLGPRVVAAAGARALNDASRSTPACGAAAPP